jgi:hypothetical protein
MCINVLAREDVIRRHRAHFVYLPLGALGGPTQLLGEIIGLSLLQPCDHNPVAGVHCIDLRKPTMLISTADWMRELDGVYTLTPQRRLGVQHVSYHMV